MHTIFIFLHVFALYCIVVAFCYCKTQVLGPPYTRSLYPFITSVRHKGTLTHELSVNSLIGFILRYGFVGSFWEKRNEEEKIGVTSHIG